MKRPLLASIVFLGMAMAAHAAPRTLEVRFEAHTPARYVAAVQVVTGTCLVDELGGGAFRVALPNGAQPADYARLFAALPGVKATVPAARPRPDFVPNEILLRFEPGTGPAEIEATATKLGATAQSQTTLGWWRLQLPSGANVLQTVAEARQLGTVKEAEPNARVGALPVATGAHATAVRVDFRPKAGEAGMALFEVVTGARLAARLDSNSGRYLPPAGLSAEAAAEAWCLSPLVQNAGPDYAQP